MKDCESVSSVATPSFPVFNERHERQLGPGMERRLSLSLLSYWEKKRAMRTMPEAHDINIEDLSPYWGDCFLLTVTNPDTAQFMIAHRGANIHSDWPMETQLEASVLSVLASRRPVLEDGQMHDADGKLVKYRQCLLPIGDDAGVKIILGGVRFRAF